jgi:hypothetical protein
LLNSIDSAQVGLYFIYIYFFFINFTSSFNKLKFVKNYLRSTMSQDRLVDSEIARKINFDNVITPFTLKKGQEGSTECNSKIMF